MGRLQLLDPVRALAAGLVLLSHVGFWTGASQIDVVGGLLARGDAGVAVFFTLSAFLLLRPHYRAAFAGPSPIPVRDYLIRRAARILPAYWIALAAVLGVMVLLGRPTGGPGTVLSHVFLLQGYTGAHYQAFTQTWSLTTEATFYLLVPLLAARARRGIRPARHLALLASLGVAGVLVQGAAAAWSNAGGGQPAAALGTSVLGHAAWFAAGAALAMLTQARRAGVALPGATGRLPALWRDPLGLVLGALLLYLLAGTGLGGPHGLGAISVGAAMSKEALYTGIAGLGVAAALSATRRMPGPSVEPPAGMRWLGDISYGVFLWHLLMLQVLYSATDRPLFSGGFWWVLLPVVGATVALSSLSAQLVEQPLLRAAHRATRPRSRAG